MREGGPERARYLLIPAGTVISRREPAGITAEAALDNNSQPVPAIKPAGYFFLTFQAFEEDVFGQQQIKNGRESGTRERTVMNRGLGLALLVVGVVLIIWGISASDSFGSDVSRFFSGTPTNKSIWLLLGGIAAAITGGISMLRPSSRP